MTTVLIQGKIPRPLGDRPWGGVRVGWQFFGYTQDATNQRPSDSGETYTQPDGTWQLSLWRNSLGIYPSYYVISFLGNNFKVTLGAGLPNVVEFSDLILANQPAVDYSEADLTNLILGIITAQLPALTPPLVATSDYQIITQVNHGLAPAMGTALVAGAWVRLKANFPS